MTTRYRHYKGGEYKVIVEAAQHTETGEKVVVYSDESGNIWSRPYEMFHGITEEGVNRFELILPLANGLKPLKGTRAAVYDYLSAYIAEHGYSPSQREIADAVGLVSSSTVNGHLERLEKAGYIDRNGGKPRAIRITGARQ